MNPVPRLECWFDFGSNYSHLALMRIAPLAAARSIEVVLKPFALGPVFKSFGWDSSPFVLQEKKGVYTWRDMERQSAKYGLPWNKPTSFPRRALLPLRLAIAAADEPWLPAFCTAIMQANFVHDQDIDNADTVSAVLHSLNVAPAPWIALAQTESAKLALRRQTDEAVQRGVFGAPTLFVGDEMFWGNDRLEDALDYALTAGCTSPVPDQR